MNVSVFDLFKMGVGPSSSHTMGPMTAAGRFLAWLRASGDLDRTQRMQITLYASLALTGRGHATDRAVILGLAGFEPRSLDPDKAEAVVSHVRPLASKAENFRALGCWGRRVRPSKIRSRASSKPISRPPPSGRQCELRT